MKILWITNIIFPKLCRFLRIPVSASGGWMLSSAQYLIKDHDIKLCIATVYDGREFVDVIVDEVRYFLLPLKGKSIFKYNKDLESYWIYIRDICKPDLVHIHGTEFPHGLAYINSCGNENVVISVQGLISVIAQYYTAGLTKTEIISNITIRDILRRDSIFNQQQKFFFRGVYEKEYINSVRHIIGRTSWDKAHVWKMNSQATYYHCNEILRPEFYNHVWNYADCEKYSIFFSQGEYPIKGLHVLLNAVGLVQLYYPDVKLYVAGDNITKKTWFRLSGYGKIIKKIIDKHNLNNKIIFTGSLDEKSMCERFLKSNLFICPSSIENSPNSLGEAHLLGIPYLASFVGGIPDISGQCSDFLYRFEEVDMLAYKICEIFKMRTFEKFHMYRNYALERYDGKKNNTTLKNIYRTVIYDSSNIY